MGLAEAGTVGEGEVAVAGEADLRRGAGVAVGQAGVAGLAVGPAKEGTVRALAQAKGPD